MKKTLALVASLAVATALSLQFGLSKAYAASHKKVDCAEVMTELQGGKKVAEAEIRYGVAPFPNDTLRNAMLDTARRVGVPEDLLHAA